MVDGVGPLVDEGVVTITIVVVEHSLAIVVVVVVIGTVVVVEVDPSLDVTVGVTSMVDGA